MAKSGIQHIDVGASLEKSEWEDEISHEIVHGTEFPAEPDEKQLYYRDDLHLPYIYTGDGWSPMINSTLAAMTLYVDAGAGDDANPGTSASPKETIKGALDSLPQLIAHACTICVRGQQDYPENNVHLGFSRFNTLAPIIIKAVNAADEDMYDNGVADAGAGNDELDDTSKSWSVDQFNGAYVFIYKGTGAGQIRTILDTTATRLTTTANWTTNPDATSYYAIIGGATLTGTGTKHIEIAGKSVRVYGFAHEGATFYDIYFSDAAFGNSYYNYHKDSVVGTFGNNQSNVNYYYNYSSASSSGCWAQNNSLIMPRNNVFNGGTYGCHISYGSLMVMHATYLNYFDGCTTGIYIASGCGCIAKSSQVFNACGADVSPAVSSEIPKWWN